MAISKNGKAECLQVQAFFFFVKNFEKILDILLSKW